MKVTVIVPVLTSLMVANVQGCTTPPPAIGDILVVPDNSDPKLTGYYEVLIYYSDGETKADYGGVCADNSYEEEARVICRQLGYHYNDFQYRSTNSPVWFNNIQCDNSNTPHILRCQNKVISNEDRNSPTVCGPDNYRLLVNCDFTQPLECYDGQVSLCPTDIASSDTNISSTSFGLVGIYYKEYVAWNGINQKDGNLLGAYEADTICRQMGFTGAYPGTAVTRNVDNYAFLNCFSNTHNRPPYQFQHGSWVTTNNITCHGPQQCLGCCFKYPYRGTCNTAQCDEQNNLVIRCAFDPSKINLIDGTAGSENDCKLDSKKNVGQCESGFTADNSQEVKHLKIALGLVATFLGSCGCCCLCYCYKTFLHDRCMVRCRRVVPAKCCREYVPIDNPPVDNNRQNNQNQDEDEQA